MLKRFAVTITLLSLTLTAWVHAQVVHFPDPNLRAAIVEDLGVDPDRITRVALQRLTRLGVIDREIESLEGLQHAPNLRLLDLSGNPISDLAPLVNLTNLEELLLSGGRISDLTPLANLHNLDILILNGNDITDISPLGGLTNLWVLKMSYNGISDLAPLAGLTNLEELLLNENRISDVEPLRGLTNLRTLKIEGNLIVDHSPLDGLSIAHFTYDQVVHFPDPNLRAAIAEYIGVDPERITQIALWRLERLDLPGREIESLKGLQYAPNLRLLDLANNRISDLTPLAGLQNLEELGLNRNAIKDVSPLASLTNLLVLTIERNLITDVEPLRGLANLHVLKIGGNSIVDHSPLDSLSLAHFTYDQTCDISPMPIRPRLANRTFPSIWANWGATLNLPHLTNMEITALHDYYGSGLQHGHRFFYNGTQWEIRSDSSEPDPRKIFDLNPNMIFLAEVRLKNSGGSIPPDFFPDDHPYWLRDASGAIAIEYGRRLINFAHPDVQDIIVGQALAVAKCGFYDGIFFDWWHDFSSTVGDLISIEDAVAVRENIVRRIRAETRPDFLIIGNTNDRIIPITGHYLNGGWMEADLPGTEDRREQEMREARDALQWLETNLREPRINLLQIGSDDSEPPDSDYNQQLMRATTTMSLTHSDGYVQFSIGTGDDHYWYDFWDADLGRPLSEAKAQFYENREGLYIREFTNGWAVYNHSGEAQVITLPEEAQGVASGLVNTEHALPNLDGEMYLRVKTKNPADLNGDGIVNILDLTLVAQALGTDDLNGDVNGDGVINVFDLVFVANQF